MLVVPTAWLAKTRLAGVAVIAIVLGGTSSSYTRVVEFAPLFSIMSKVFVLALKAPISSQLPPDVGQETEFGISCGEDVAPALPSAAGQGMLGPHNCVQG